MLMYKTLPSVSVEPVEVAAKTDKFIWIKRDNRITRHHRYTGTVGYYDTRSVAKTHQMGRLKHKIKTLTTQLELLKNTLNTWVTYE